jgi:hypothetical protein
LTYLVGLVIVTFVVEATGREIIIDARHGLTERAEFKTDREQLQQLYKELSLVLTSQKAETTEELGRVRRGRKTIETYRTNL